MPPATGFQYTPPSYLLRASDTTNRPWNKDEEEQETSNDYDLLQEDRPQTRRESHLDAHFQQRVRNKQSRYRDILKGELSDVSSSAGEDNNGDDEDSILASAARADSYNELHSAKLNVQSANSNEAARKSRMERIGGIAEPRKSSSKAESDAETARSLRAQRLRSSLLKQTPDEYETQANLEMRRFQRKQEEAEARKAERRNSTVVSEASQRKIMEQERMALQAEREALAAAKEEAAHALQRAAELNEERRRQRETDARLEQERADYDRISRRRERALKSSNNNKKKSLRAKKYVTDNDENTFMTEFDAENDFAFLNDLSGIVRDTGLLKTCAGCFGDTEDVLEENDMAVKAKDFGAKASRAISSVFVPDLVPSSDNSSSENDETPEDGDSIRRSRVYARYRA